jgi:hypothetical protein
MIISRWILLKMRCFRRNLQRIKTHILWSDFFPPENLGVCEVLICCMEQSPSWEANRFVASQEILRVLLNPKVHYRIHNCSPPVSILSQQNPVHTPTSHFLKIHPSITPPTPGSPQWSLSLRFPHENPVHASLLPQPRYMPRPSHSRFYFWHFSESHAVKKQ